MIIGEANLAGINQPINEDDNKFSKEEALLLIEEVDEKFLEIQKKIILANFNEENKPAEEIIDQVLGLIELLSELAEKPDLQEIYLNLAGKYTFLAKFIKDFTNKEVPSFPV